MKKHFFLFIILFKVLIILPWFGYSQFVVNNSAIALGNNTFQLTPYVLWVGGSVWYEYKTDLSKPFTLSGWMNFGNDTIGADGNVFVLQNSCLNAGMMGGGIGYRNMPGQSLGVEFDTYKNTTPITGDQDNHDPTFDHIGIFKNGSVVHDTVGLPNPNDLLKAYIQASPTKRNIKDGLPHNFKITWDPIKKKLQVFFEDTIVKPRASIICDIPNAVFSGNPFVYWGFTSATGGERNIHTVHV